MFPTRIYLTGFMGSGKSTIGPRVAQVLGYRFVDLDDAVAARAGKSVQAIFAEEGEAAFRALEGACLAETARQVAVVVAVGGGALAAEENLQDALASGTVVYLQVPAAELAARLQRSPTPRPLLFGDDGRMLPGPALQQKIKALLARREPFYRRAHLVVDVGGRSVDEAVEAVVEALRQNQRG